MDTTNAAAAGGAALANETARVQAGRIEDQREQTFGIVGGSEAPCKPLSTVAADLAQFLTPHASDLATQACRCRGRGTCDTCSGWVELADRIQERQASLTASPGPLSVPRAAGAVLRFPVNAVRLRSVGRAAWVLGYELEEARDERR